MKKTIHLPVWKCPRVKIGHPTFGHFFDLKLAITQNVKSIQRDFKRFAFLEFVIFALPS
jgi:hypothetical protein